MRHQKKILFVLVMAVALIITATAALGQLEILESSIQVNGNVYTPGSRVSVAPGQTVTLRFDFQNNNNFTVGHIETTLADDIIDISPDLPHNGVCTGVSCQNGQWVLTPTATGFYTYTFTIPYDVNPMVANFDVALTVDSADAATPETRDTATVQFTLNRPAVDVEVIDSSVQLSRNEVSCNNQVQLTFDIVNTGSQAVTPELLLYDQNAVPSSFNTRTGKFTFATTPRVSLEQTLDPLAPGERATITQTIDVSNLASGSNRLYFYIVNPFFNQASYFIGDQGSVAITKLSCVQSYTPSGTSVTTAAGTAVQFGVTLREIGAGIPITWTVDGANVAQGESYAFTNNDLGSHTVSVNVNNAESKTWTVLVTERFFSNNYNHNIPPGATDAELAAFPDFTIENAEGQIVFNSPVDLRNIRSLDEVVSIGENGVAVDTANAPGLAGRAATVTLHNTYTNPIILVSEQFNSGNLAACPAARCTLVSNANGEFVFVITGFSTYVVMSQQPAALDISEIVFEDMERGSEVTKTVTLRNVGTSDSVTGITAQFVNVAAKYNPQIMTPVPTTLHPGDSATFDVKFTVPEDEESGRHSIGSLRAAGQNSRGEAITTTETVYFNPRSFLKINSVKINDKTNGELKILETNTIEVEVENVYTDDMDDVMVTVTILDVDGDDIEKESESFSLNNNKEKTVTVEFDLSEENLDEEQYTIEITVEGTADDDTEHKTTETKVVDVDVEKHQVGIKKAELASSNLQCFQQTTLNVEVQNLGKEDEDEVSIRVVNSALGISLSKNNIELDNYFDEDNEYKTTFTLNLENAAPGTYPLSVEVLRDGTVDQTKEVSIVVRDCATGSTTQTGTQTVSAGLADQVRQALQARTTETGASIKASFRESNVYVAMLGLLSVLVLVAIIMGLAVLVIKKR